jgi:hypothetical protein
MSASYKRLAAWLTAETLAQIEALVDEPPVTRAELLAGVARLGEQSRAPEVARPVVQRVVLGGHRVGSYLTGRMRG